MSDDSDGREGAPLRAVSLVEGMVGRVANRGAMQHS